MSLPVKPEEGRAPAASTRASIFEREQKALEQHLAGSAAPIASFARVRELKAMAELLRGAGRLRPERRFVPLEPPFAEFVHTDLNEIDRYCLGLRAPVLTTPWERFLHRLKGNGGVPLVWSPPDDPFEDDLAFAQVVASNLDRVTLENALQFLIAVDDRIAFEAVGNRREVVLQFACGARYAPALTGILQTHYRASEFRLVEEDAFARLEGTTVWIGEYGLATSHAIPLRTLDGFSVEPMQVLMGVFDEIGDEDVVAMQVLFAPCRHPWSRNLRTAIVDELTGEPIQKEPDLEASVRDKARSPLFAVSLRTIATSPELLERFASYANQFAVEYNRLAPLDDIPEFDLPVEGVLRRKSWRPGMLWNAEELVSLVHVPPESVFSDKYERVKIEKVRAPLELIETDGILVGENAYHNRLYPIRVPPETLNKHMLVVGSTRMGKSTLMGNMIASLVEQGKGLFIVDPKGSLAKRVAASIPPGSVKRTIYFNPADRDYPIAMNLMRFARHYDRQELINDLVSILDKITVTLMPATPRMWELFSGAMRFFLQRAETDETITLRQVRDFFHDPNYRRKMIDRMEQPVERAYWEAYERNVASSRQPDTAAMGLTSRLAQLVDDPTLANILCATECRVDFTEIFKKEQVFIADLGEVGELRKNFLGRLLVAEAQLSCMARPAAERTDVFFFMDEFQDYQTSAFEDVLARGAEYRMNMVLAHQNYAQVEHQTMQSVLGNVGAIVAFRVGEDYAARLARSFAGTWSAQDFLALPAYECLTRVETSHFSLRSYAPEQYAETERLAETPDSTNAVMEHTRNVYDQVGRDEESVDPTDEAAFLRSIGEFEFEPAAYRQEETTLEGTEMDEAAFFAIGPFSFEPRVVPVYRATSSEERFLSTLREPPTFEPGPHGLEDEPFAGFSFAAGQRAANDQMTLALDEEGSTDADRREVERTVARIEGERDGASDASRWVCPSCGETFMRHPPANSRHLETCRQRQKEQDERAFACPRCDRRFATRQALNSHIGRIHGNR